MQNRTGVPPWWGENGNLSIPQVTAEHRLRNQIAIVLGYCELLLNEVPNDSPLRTDLVEMHKAASIAMQLLREGDADAC